MRRLRGAGGTAGAGRALAAVVATLLAAPPAAGQGEPPAESSGPRTFTLQPAFPNPFSDRTRIPFILGPGLFEDGRTPVVSMRVFNLLQQVVARPVLGGEGRDPGAPLERRAFTRPGSYEAEWDGRDLEGEPVRPGPYFVQLEVNGRVQVRKLLLTRDGRDLAVREEGTPAVPPGAARPGGGAPRQATWYRKRPQFSHTSICSFRSASEAQAVGTAMKHP